MLAKPKTCSGCPLYEYSQIGFGNPEGTGKNGVLILGEALGEKERMDGLPFRPHAESGSVLEMALRKLGLDRKDFVLFNIVNCQPPFNKLDKAPYEFEAVEKCSQYLKEVIRRFKPKVILALGGVPLRHISTEYWKLVNEGAEDSILKKLFNTSTRGFKLESIYGIPVVPSLHPSYIRRNGNIYLGVLMHDIQQALKVSRGEIKEFKPNYSINPSRQQLESFLQECLSNPELEISHDIETPFTLAEVDESEILFRDKDVRDIDSIQFSIRKNEAIFLDLKNDDFKELNWEYARKILATPNTKIGWNSWEFDEINIKYNFGEDLPKGKSIDAMWEWKWLNQDFTKLGRALQFATNFYSDEIPAWKHLSNSDPTLYGCIDVDATFQIHKGLQKELSKYKLERDVHGVEISKSKTLLEGFNDDILNLHRILIAASKRGLPIDIKAREELRDAIIGEIEKASEILQKQYPDKLRKVTPLKGYKHEPAEISQIKRIYDSSHLDYGSISTNNLGGDTLFRTNDESGLILPKEKIPFEEIVELLTRRKDANGKLETSGLVQQEFRIDGTNKFEKRWCRKELFKPASKDQVLNYIKLKKYKIPKKKDRQTGTYKETTSKDLIYQLWETTGDKFLETIIYIRELKKMLSTYIGEGSKKGKESAWIPKDINENGIGRIHTTFTFLPVTGQLSSQRPNIQNIPKGGGQWATKGYQELSEKFRRTIRADKGKVLLEADFHSFHAKTFAGISEDKDYLRLANSDIHSFVAAHIIKNQFISDIQKLRGKGMNKNVEERKLLKEEIDKRQVALDFLVDLDDWLSFPDEKLLEKLKWIKKNYKFPYRDRQAKPAILGIALGMGANRLWRDNPKSFKNAQEAQKVIDLLRKLFPRLFLTQDKLRALADKQSYLISRYGYIQRFYNVFDYRLIREKRPAKFNEIIFQNKKGEWWVKSPGTDSESVIAFYVQNDAFGKIKESMRELEELGFNERYGFINQIHDALLFECSEDLVEEAAKNIKEIMERPAKFLNYGITPNGLVAKVEVSVGKNWGSFNPDRPEENPDGMKELKI